MADMQTSRIYLSQEAVKHNLDYIRKMIGPEVKFSSVVKGNAYGHGIEQMVPLLIKEKVDHFSVFSAAEALRVRKVIKEVSSEDQIDIMIMGMVDDEQVDWAVEEEIEFYIFDLIRLQRAKEAAARSGKAAKIHIELETGMNRTGFNSKELRDALDYIRIHSEYFDVVGLCTHYAGAESISNYYRIKKQKARFNKLAGKVRQQEIQPKLYHTACSAAMIRYPSTRMDMVRIGILQYGFFPSREVMVDLFSKRKIHDYPLKRIIEWKSTVMDVKEIKHGEFVGYGTSYLANEDMKIALVPVGYSHGFTRSLSNQGRVLINGHRLGVVGTVNMNMMSVDVTHVSGITKGDEVVIIGKQGDQEVSVASFSENTNQVNYELLTRLPGDIPRIVV